jgi:amidase
VPCLPPAIGAWKANFEEEPLMPLFNSHAMAVFTSLFNVTGQPAISVLVHHDVALIFPSAFSWWRHRGARTSSFR